MPMVFIQISLQLTNIASTSCTLKKTTKASHTTHNRIRKEEIPQQFQEKLKWVKCNFYSALEKYNERTGDFNRRQTLIKQRWSYKRIKYLIEKYKKEDKMKKIASLEGKDPRAFWAAIRKLSCSKHIESLITPGAWKKH